MDRGITDTLAAADLPSRVGPERCAPPCWCGSLAPEGSTGQMVHSPHPPRHRRCRTRPRCSHHHHHRRSIPKYCCCCCCCCCCCRCRCCCCSCCCCCCCCWALARSARHAALLVQPSVSGSNWTS